MSQILPSASLEFEFPFDKVDFFFAKTLAPQSDENILCFLAYLFNMAREGHLCCLIKNNYVLPEPPYEMRDRIILGSQSISQDLIGENGPLVKVGFLWYLHCNFICENRFLEGLKRFQQLNQIVYSEKMLEERPLTQEQKEAIVKALNSSLCVVCGGPGTGKTHTAIELITLFLQYTQKTVAVCAPTGKATANLRPNLELFKERCHISTLHTLLQRPYHPYDLVIVDEGSMLDAFLMQKLLFCLKHDAQLIIFGDVDQLPSVGSGAFFKDLVLNNMCEKAILTTCLRTDLQEIVDLTKKIKKNELLPCIPLPSPEEIFNSLHCTHDMDEMFAHYRSLRILTPQRKGPYGVDTLNALFYRYSKQKAKNGLIPVMITVNDPQRGLYNGDFGLLDETLGVAHFEGGKSVLSAILPSYEYGFVLSIHKSQGSEYQEVRVLLPEGSERFGKELLYTAVTRARKKAVLYSNESTLEKIMNKETHRLSGLTLAWLLSSKQ